MEDHTPLSLCYHIVVTRRDPAGSASGPREIFHSWKKRYTPSAFAREIAAYAAARLKEGAVSQAKLIGYRLWHAASLHARQTAEMMIGTNTEIPI